MLKLIWNIDSNGTTVFLAVLDEQEVMSWTLPGGIGWETLINQWDIFVRCIPDALVQWKELRG